MKRLIILFNLCLLFANCLSAQNALSPDIKVEVKNEKTINKGSLEFSPAFYENGIIFISDNKEGITTAPLKDAKIDKSTFHIFLSRRNEDGELKTATPFAPELTTKWHEGPITLNKTNDKLFFSRNDFLDGKVEKAKDGVVKQMIISADMNNGKWTNEKRLSFNDKEFDFHHPSINVDDNILYFASNRPGGYGGTDIWKVEKAGDTWGEPVNLGPGVNTAGTEGFPFIHADGTLFFSSKGHDSNGGFDVFFTRPFNGEFVSPVNLGSKFNTSSDDFGLIIDRDKRNGYFSSNREGGNGQDDIYSFFIDETLGEDVFQYPENHPAFLASNGAINLPGAGGMTNNGSGNGNNNGTGFGNNKVTLFVADRLTGSELSSATVEYVDLEQLSNTEIVTDQDGNIIQLLSSSNGDVVTLSTEKNAVTGYTDAEGAYDLKIGDGNYLINITQPGYKPKQILVNASENQNEFMVLMDKSTNCASIDGFVVNAGDNPVPGANVTVRESGDFTEQVVTAASNGQFSLCLECGKSYSITVEKNGESSAQNIVVTPDCNGGQTQQMTFRLNSSGIGLADGTTIRLKRIYYNFNDASIRPDAKDELNTLVSILSAYPTLQIEVASHTDARGGTSYNRQLSQRRADKVVAYLVQQGISASRLNPVGYGESELLNSCYDGTLCSELDHQYNRRTELRVKELNQDIGIEYVTNAPENVDSAPSSVLNGGGGSSYSGSSSSGSSSRGGRYQVVAGSFSSRSNADDRLSRVQQLGFDNAKVVRGRGVANNVVLVKSFSSYNQARQLADEIENVHNINTYVKRGR